MTISQPTVRRRLFCTSLALLAFAAPAAAQTRELGIDVSGMDRTVRPQDDFNLFVNGNWIRRAEIPSDRTSFGSFDMLDEKSTAAVRELIEALAAAQHSPGSEAQKVGDYYRAYMDTARIEQLGTRPLTSQLVTIAGIKKTADLPKAFALLAPYVRGPFGMSVSQDPKNSSVYAVGVGQGGLSLPDRDYYLRPEEKFVQIRKDYTNYLTKVFTLLDHDDAAGAAARVLALETSLAEKQWDRVKLRDRNLSYNKMPVSGLVKLAPGFNWTGYLKTAGLGKAQEVIVRQPDYFQALDAIFRETPASTWREYLTARLVGGYASILPRAYGQAYFDFYGRTLSGQQEMQPRWKMGVAAVEGSIGEAVGKLYVEKNFQPEAKARMDALVKNLLEAFRQGINELEWMSPATKAQAQQKLAKFTVKIGYPDKWRDYSKVQVSATDAVGNAMRAAKFSYDDMIGNLGQPVDRTRWGMLPQTVNAYYNSANNEIVFPAAILQPPFFDVNADDAVNYGGIGAVIGHEISHGFDDQGRKSDGDGNLRDWWTAEDAKAFEAKTRMLGAEYESYSPLEGMHINGALTMGENIGDLSGLAVAYRAYRNSLGGQEAPVIDGFTGDQRFFMGWAQVWRTKMRDDAMRQQLMTNPHSPGMYRAFVPLTNIDAFYRAFEVKQGDRLWRAPEERVRIW